MCGPAYILASLQRAVRSDTEHATCDARHKADAGAASFMHLRRPITRQTIPDPSNLQSYSGIKKLPH
eukprot:5430782-Prymnesium_polylepis.1